MTGLRPYQADLMAGIHDAWKSGARRVAAVMATGGGKGHPLDTEVPTPDGLRLWGELRPGDRVFGSDGSSVEVTAVYDRGALPTFRVRMSDGSSVLVDGEHLWRVRDAQDRKSKTLTTQQLIDGGMRPVRGGGRGYRWHVPMAGAVARARADLPLDPYVVGALIANGSMTGRHTQLTTADPEVAKLISAVTSVKKVNDATDGVCDRYYLAGLTSVTQCLGMRVYSYEKRVPRAYLESSRDQRIALLHGLMDGDGTARDVTRRSVEYSTTSPGLAEDVRELVTSLGGTANLSVSVREGKRDEYQVGVLMPSGINPFQLARKAQAGVQSKRQMQPRRAIVSIERVEDRPIRCISVDADDHLYLITRHHIVTHNTHVFSHLAEQCRQQGKPTLVLAHRTELIDQAVIKLRKVAAGADIGRMQGSLKQWRHDIVVGSVQTCSRDGALKLIGARRWGLVIVDECFPAGTPIDGRPIETIRPGDMVRTWDEKSRMLTVGRVVGTQSRVPMGMVRVHFEDGWSMACTPNHPLLTSFGWLAAEQSHGASLVSFTHDVAVHGVWGSDPGADQVAAGRTEGARKGLLPERVRQQGQGTSVVGNDGEDESQVRIGAHEAQQSDGARRCPTSDDRNAQGGRRLGATDQGWQRQADAGTPARAGRDARMADGGDRQATGRRDAMALQVGHSAPDNEGVCRGGRQFAQSEGASRSGRAPDSTAGFARVVRVEVLEPGSDGTYGGVCPDGLVYNFEVEGTHTYLVGDERSGVVVHNCHHVAAPSYQKVLQAAGCFRADGPVLLGVTATLDRSDGLSLGDTFEAVAEPRIGLIDLIKQGYLVRPRGIRVKIRDLDLDSVRRVAGDLNQGQLGAAMHAAMAPQKLVEAWIEHAKGRPTIAFMPTVAISEEVATTFREAGFPFAHLSDKTHPRERAATLEAFRRGEIVGLCNVGLFTEGTDLPTTSCVILKMTSSSTLYQQMVGRGLRLHDPAQCECPIQPCEFGVKSDCIILDPSGVAKRHTLATLASLTGAPAEGEVPDDLLMYEEDLEEEPEREESPDVAPVEYEDGDALDHELFDLFGESSTTWLRTPGGTWFVPVPDGLIYLGRYDVLMGEPGWEVRYASETYGRGLISKHARIEGAMRAGEEYIAARPMWQADRNAPWRSMRAWGSTRTKGEIADEKAMSRAAALLDS